MAYEPLHHKYRPKTFAELVGQAAITTTLTNALRQQRIAPAYLFTGARGTGKTSSARILAKSLNCLKSQVPTEKPCGECEVCRAIANGSALDVIEIDAASNTGVDNIRELIERAQFAPVQCRYKVYVIDECHMLSAASFNALLKTLEEPPNRVVFVLATTDPQRVLPTIISRCQRFDFRRIELGAMVQHLSQIANQEAIEITPDALQLVAQIAQGGLRDAESMLDQLSLLEPPISVERVWDLVGAVPERDLLALVTAIGQGQPTAVIDRVRHLMDRGREPLIVLQNLASFYRDLLIAKTTPDRNDLAAITPPTWAEMCTLVQSLEVSLLLKSQQHLRSSEGQVKNTTQPRLWLEVTLLGLLPNSISASQDAVNPLPAIQPPASKLPVSQPVASPAPRPSAPQPVSQPVPQPTPQPVASPVPSRQPGSSQPPEPVPSAAAAAVSAESETPSSQPAPKPAPAPPEPAEPQFVPAASPINLEEVWQTILGLLQPPGTQALFKQQGSLLALESSTARIGISSQPLFKMAQLRVANLEAALTQYAQRPVKVSLEVVAGQFTPATSPAMIADAVQNGAASKPIEAAKPVFKEPLQNGSRPTVSEAKTAYVPEEPAAPPPVETLEAEPPPTWHEDEVSRAAKSLAQMFNGQIVHWDNDPPASDDEATLARSAVDLGADLPVEDGDPDNDVPF